MTISQIASMGPRHLSRGILNHEASRAVLEVGFNGATASEPWNLVLPVPASQWWHPLQWGHGI